MISQCLRITSRGSKHGCHPQDRYTNMATGIGDVSTTFFTSSVRRKRAWRVQIAKTIINVNKEE